MHPLIQEQIKTVEGRIEDLRQALETQRQRKSEDDARREATLQEHWREKKRAATLEHMATDLETVQTEVEIYETERSHITETLQTALARLKGLRGTLGQ